MVYTWIILHKEELWDRWNKAVCGKNFGKISPKINKLLRDVNNIIKRVSNKY